MEESSNKYRNISHSLTHDFEYDISRKVGQVHLSVRFGKGKLFS
jgi:hypothetical protein